MTTSTVIFFLEDTLNGERFCVEKAEGARYSWARERWSAQPSASSVTNGDERERQKPDTRRCAAVMIIPSDLGAQLLPDGYSLYTIKRLEGERVSLPLERRGREARCL